MNIWIAIGLILVSAICGLVVGLFIAGQRIQRAQGEVRTLRQRVQWFEREQDMRQCRATTRDGAPCESTVGIVDGLCAIHRRQSA